jgi:hypothetical protein
MGALQGFTTSYFTPEIPHPTTVLVPDINLRVHGCRIRDDTNPGVGKGGRSGEPTDMLLVN